jgi:hypothetical protein
LSQHSRKFARALVGRLTWVLAGSAGVFFADVWGSPSARADGAFPASQAVLLAADRPKEMILATNFGLVFSEDDGTTWSYACENPAATLNAVSYVVGPSPQDRIYAISSLGAAVSSDGGCSWALGGGDLVNTAVNDVFPDPASAERVFAIAIPVGAANPTGSIFVSEDGGLTYTISRFTAAAGALVTGVEASTTDPNRVYVTIDGSADSTRPELARSSDGGASFEVVELAAALGAVKVRLVAVDPTDASVIVLRLFSIGGATPAGQSLAITRDGGDTWATPVRLSGGDILGFARLSTGTLVAVATSSDGPVLLRSRDGGVTFSTSALSFSPMGLATRAGILYASANEFAAGETDLERFSLASSTDEGDTWSARFRFAEIGSVRACVKAACQSSCSYLSGLTLFPATACNMSGAVPSGGAGSGGGSGSGSGGCAFVLGPHALGWVSSIGVSGSAILVAAVSAARRKRRPPR